MYGFQCKTAFDGGSGFNERVADDQNGYHENRQEFSWRLAPFHFWRCKDFCDTNQGCWHPLMDSAFIQRGFVRLSNLYPVFR